MDSIIRTIYLFDSTDSIQTYKATNMPDATLILGITLAIVHVHTSFIDLWQPKAGYTNIHTFIRVK